MLKAIIVDDEQDGRDVLSILLREHFPEIAVVEICEGGKEGVAAIIKHQPELVFLDIDMPGMNGFDILDCVKDLKLKVIFVTAHNNHAVRAFKYSAIDYILKPASREALGEAIEKAKSISFISMQNTQYDLLLQNLKNKNSLPDVIALPMADGLQVVKVADIIYCKADRNYSTLHMMDKETILVSRPLKEFENLLVPHDFFRIHNSALINVSFIKKYIRGDGGYVIMHDGATIEVSRQKKDEFLKHIKKI